MKKTKNLVIITILVICLVAITILVLMNSPQIPSYTKDPYIECIKDEKGKTLTVKSVYTGKPGANWDEVFVVNNNATIPISGIIKVNDVIENCTGEIVIVWEREHMILFRCEFY